MKLQRMKSFIRFRRKEGYIYGNQNEKNNKLVINVNYVNGDVCNVGCCRDS